MISRLDAEAGTSRGRAARIALAASLLVHVLAFALAFDVPNLLARLPHRPHRPPSDETVAMSTVLHIEHRARPAPARAASAVRPPHRNAAIRRPPHPERFPMPRHVRQQLRPITPAAKPATAPLPAARSVLAKRMPRATPQAVRTAPPHAVPSVPPRRIATEPPRQVAIAPHRPVVDADRPERPQAYSAAQLAAIQANLAKSLQHDRTSAPTLSSALHVTRPAGTIKRYAIDTPGLHATLNGARGVCVPIKTWLAEGLVNFYVTCTTQRVGGGVRNEAIPWPLRYRPSQISYGADGSPEPPAGESIAMPPRGWHLDRKQYVDPDVIEYLKERGYAV